MHESLVVSETWLIILMDGEGRASLKYISVVFSLLPEDSSRCYKGNFDMKRKGNWILVIWAMFSIELNFHHAVDYVCLFGCHTDETAIFVVTVMAVNL